MHPILFQIEIFGRVISFYSYGTMLSISFALSIIIALRIARREGYPLNLTLNTYMIAVVSSLVGARLLNVITNLGDYAEGFPLSIFDFQNRDGMVAYGGYMGGIIGSWLYARSKKWNFLRFGDCAAPLLGLGLGFTRIGCLLAGCDYGKPTDLPIGIRFPQGSFAYFNHARTGLIGHGAEASYPVFPTQPIESISGFLIFFFLLWFHYRKRKYAGQTLALFLVTYGTARFLIEFQRGDSGRGEFLFFSTSQWIALLTIGFAAWILAKKFPMPEEPVLALQRAEEERLERKAQDKRPSKKNRPK